MTALHIDDFEAFFLESWDTLPFPWQSRLARQAWQERRFPQVLDLPTGVGKTAVLDIAVFLLALDQGRSFPRRIGLVVDRRVVVDQAYQRASQLCERLAAGGEVRSKVADRLRAMGLPGQEPLIAVQLRGGIARDDDWARTPTQPLVFASTVDQVGSRLLFRGYGSSEGARPIHAGLLGQDTLLFLDEVHLSEPFRQTLQDITENYRGRDPSQPERWQVVQMSATVGPTQSRPFQLDELDRQHAVLARRLQATKPCTLVEVQVRGKGAAARLLIANEAVQQALALVDETHRTIGVVVNRVDTARHAWRNLKQKGVETILLTGRTRPFDRDQLLDTWADRLRSGRVRDPASPPLIVVATQCIEAGADFDLDGLVAECASLDALRQRFGRVDRLGELTAAETPARGVVIIGSNALQAGHSDPIYRDAMAATWAWMRTQERPGFGIEELQAPTDDGSLLAPRPRAPVLMPVHLDLWCQTRPTPQADPDPAFWLHGPDRGAPEVQVVWRAELDGLLDEESRGDDAALEAVESCPPGSMEALSLPLWAVRAWLARTETDSPADVGLTVEDQRLEPGLRPAVAWRGDDSQVIRSADQIRPGDTLVVPCSYGGIAEGAWDPLASEPVPDLGSRTQWAQRRIAVLRLHPLLLPENISAPTAAIGDEGGPTSQDIADSLHAAVEALPRDPWVTEILSHWGAVRWRRVQSWWVITHATAKARPAVSTSDESASFLARTVLLDSHLQGVGALAGHMAQLCGLDDAFVRALRLAGELHDLGKADPRFQRMLHGGDEIECALAIDEGRLLAKSAIGPGEHRRRLLAQRTSGYPKGTRHELLSLAMALDNRQALADRFLDGREDLMDLVLHLVASHHGWCRPLPPPVVEPEQIEVKRSVSGIELRSNTQHGQTRLDGGVPDRFWLLSRRYGWWGLAWLETILRLADHRRSELESQGGAK